MQSREDCESSRMPTAPGKPAALLEERGASAKRTQVDLRKSLISSSSQEPSAKFNVMDELDTPLVASCKVGAAGNRIVMQPEKQGGSFIEDVRSKRRKRIFERNGAYVLPCCVVKQNSQKRVSALVKSCPHDQQVYP